MRRTYNNINRNNNGFSFSDVRSNIPIHAAVPQDFFINQLWVQGEETNGVKIIELNSSESSREPSIKNGDGNDNYLNNEVLAEIENNYKINEEARQRRRIKNEQNFSPAKACYFEKGNPFFAAYDNERPINHQMNCFTIINNEQYSDSSSSDNYDGIEIIELDNNADENNYWDHVYKDEVDTFNSNTQPEKRTVWIYSYKNKRLLAENDFELVNIPSKDTFSSTSTSRSISDEEEAAANNRVGSPIPTYIPRLDLSLVQTLSTVTEKSERNKSNRSSRERIHIQPKNNWLTERIEKVKKETDVLNWMALSPRERRRRSINLTEVTSVISHEADVTCPEGGNKITPISERSNKTSSKSIQVEVELHEEPVTTEIETKRKDTTIADMLPIKLSYYEDDEDNANEEYNELDLGRIPSIEIDGKIDKTEITEPMEKLDCDSWINGKKEYAEEICNEDVSSNIRESAKIDNVDERYSESYKREVNHRLWMKNLQLMKPPQWTAYLPITCSPPSLDLSLSLPSVNSKKSWFKRLTRCIKCCK